MSTVRSRWLKKHDTARGWAATWRKRYISNPTPENKSKLVAWRTAVDYAKRVLRRQQPSASLVIVRSHGVFRTSGYGALGPIREVTVHHPVSGQVSSISTARSLIHAYDSQHARQYGGGIGYHEFIDAKGRVYPVRSPKARGAHTARRNSGNYGISVFGNYEVQKPSSAALATLKARLTQAPPRSSGLPDLRGKDVRGHREWPGQSTACPGRFLLPHVQALR